MSFTLTRMFAYFTLLAYLVVGTAAVRFLTADSVDLSFDTTYLSLLSNKTVLASQEVEVLEASKMAFTEIQFPKEVVRVAAKKVVIPKKTIKAVEAALKIVQVQKNELPFHEPVKLAAVQFDYSLPSNLVALYKDFSLKEEVMMAAAPVVEDKISTTMAANVEAEPEFFEYESKKAEVVEVAEVKKIETTKEVKVDTAPQAREEVIAEVTKDFADTDLATYDYSSTEARPVAESAAEEVNVNDLVAFDYSTKKVEAVTAHTASAPVSVQAVVPVAPNGYSQPSAPANVTWSDVTTQKSKAAPAPINKTQSVSSNALVASAGVSSQLAIQATGMNLKTTKQLNGFEVRFQDDQSVAMADYGLGEVLLKEQIAASKMTRTMTLLKPGYIPTSTDAILEEGGAGVSIPLMEEESFNKEIMNYESRGAVGALLVELDDTTEVAKLDVPFGKVITLDGNLKKTTSDDFRYQLFIGVQAGNAFLTYVGSDGSKVAKIVHIHEREITFDANFYQDIGTEKVTLLEEDLLSKEKSPLIIGSDSVKVFATDIVGKKINNHTYKINFGKSHLGGRQYLELSHQKEPVFVGLQNNKNVAVPSERFMSYILSNFEGSTLGNRCLVQVNLSKPVSKVDVGSESVGSNLLTYTQMLDRDGKFYESVSDKTEKVVIVGENQSGDSTNKDGRINIKIEYVDGSNEFVNSYCSPNTYLVEQL